jgi:pyruvate carboxylase
VCNRGEIAIRIFRACTELGIETVAIYTHEDRFSLHRYKADEAYQIGTPGSPVRAYLNVDEVVAIAKACGADAIHPGYGFLSERADLRAAAEAAGITFVGPSVETLEVAGDKVKTLELARKLKIPTVPGSGRIDDLASARSFAKKVGFPLIFKASFGGGGRGMRVVRGAAELEAAYRAASSEAESAFGRADVYLEKYLERPRHIEVQLLGDGSGKVAHLFERDCSVQRRHQKVIEVAPAVSLGRSVREKLYAHALSLGRALKLLSAATAEFLIDKKGAVYFIEINPRIQVEHTVTEEITGVDLVQSQIRIAQGRSLGELGISQKELSPHGVAIQCRVTTEDPANGFQPDSGKLLTYRSASGFGIRLDAGSAFTGAAISPYYDSLLVKVTAHGRTIEDAAQKLRRCLREFRIRGVKTNIPFLEKLLAHPVFLEGETRTTFIEETPELFQFAQRRDRANRLLRFLGEVTVNGHAAMPGLARPKADYGSPLIAFSTAGFPAQYPSAPAKGWRDVLLREGIKKFLGRVREAPALLITDTTIRDAHQSLLATRLRTHDMLQAARHIAHQTPQLFSLEMWGGATFDVCLRFLKEDPWERLSQLRATIPNILFQMLIRGANVVGYKNYPDNVVREFVKESAAAGIDIFRIFDCFNNLEQMETTISAVKKTGALAECCICYTGDLLEEEARRKAKQPSKFDLRYYLARAKELERAGADILAIKDMAGLLRPYSAEVLIKSLREETDLPIHFHTHDTAGGQVGSYLKAAEAGVDIVDCAISSMSGVTSQPCLEGLVAALSGTPRDTGLSLEKLTPFGSYWERVRGWYAPFESDLRAATGEVYLNEIPGGQYSNFRPQAQSLGVGDRWDELKRAYRDVDRLLGRVIKVTPSSKAIGDLAIFLISNNLTVDDLVARADELNFPASVVELFQGELGTPYGGFPEELRRRVLRGRAIVKDATGSSLAPADFKDAEKKASECLGEAANARDTLSHILYPHVYRDYAQHHQAYGDVMALPTPPFLYGLREAEEVVVDLEPGKRLFITLVTVSDAGANGERAVIFELNGQTRSITVRDKKIAPKDSSARKAEPGNQREVGAPLAGALVEVAVKIGQSVKREEKLFVVEAMKMQSIVKAPKDGKVKAVGAKVGTKVEAGELVIELE